MNKCLLYGLLVLLAQPRLALSSEPDAAKTPAEATNRIPIEVREKSPPRLLVNVDGAELQLQFDLGDSTPLVLQKRVLDSIKAVPTGESVKGRGVDGVFEVPLYKVKRVQIGTAVFTNVTARLDAARKGYEPDPKEAGFLGTGLLKPYQLVIDYPQRTMTLLNAAQLSAAPEAKTPGRTRHSNVQGSLVSPTGTSSSAACRGTTAPFLPKFRGEPVTTVNTDLGPAILWWDTGAPVSVLRKTFGEQAASKPSGDSFTTQRFAIGDVNFGPLEFERWAIDLPEFDGFVGYPFFAKHAVCVDFPGNRLMVAQ